MKISLNDTLLNRSLQWFLSGKISSQLLWLRTHYLSRRRSFARWTVIVLRPHTAALTTRVSILPSACTAKKLLVILAIITSSATRAAATRMNAPTFSSVTRRALATQTAKRQVAALRGTARTTSSAPATKSEVTTVITMRSAWLAIVTKARKHAPSTPESTGSWALLE